MSLVIVIGIICVIIGLFLLSQCYKNDKNRKRCRYLLKGTVADHRRVRISKSFYWRPLFCYTFNNIEYKAETPFVTREKRFEAGDEVDIYIDEKHPEVFWIPSEAEGLNASNQIAGGMFLLGGIVACIFFFFGDFLLNLLLIM